MNSDLYASEAPGEILKLYDEALPVVFGYFVRRCGDRATAEDLTAQTFLSAMATAGQQDPPPVSVPWLLGTARQKLAEHCRSRADPLPVAVNLSETDDWDLELNRSIAEQVLLRLPEPLRTVVMLRYMDDRSLPECADLLGQTLTETQSLLLLARKRFRALYPTGDVS